MLPRKSIFAFLVVCGAAALKPASIGTAARRRHRARTRDAVVSAPTEVLSRPVAQDGAAAKNAVPINPAARDSGAVAPDAAAVSDQEERSEPDWLAWAARAALTSLIRIRTRGSEVVFCGKIVRPKRNQAGARGVAATTDDSNS